MSDLFDDLDFEMLGGDFEDPFENEPVDPMPPPVPGMPNAGHQPVQHPKAAVQKASEADCTEGPAQHRILAPPHQASAEAFTNAEAQVTKADDNAADTAAYHGQCPQHNRFHHRGGAQGRYRELSVQWSALLMRTWGQCNQVPSLGHPFTVCGTSFRRI